MPPVHSVASHCGRGGGGGPLRAFCWRVIWLLVLLDARVRQRQRRINMAKTLTSSVEPLERLLESMDAVITMQSTFPFSTTPSQLAQTEVIDPFQVAITSCTVETISFVKGRPGLHFGKRLTKVSFPQGRVCLGRHCAHLVSMNHKLS